MSRQMKFVAFLMAGPTSHHHAMWRHPQTENRFLDPAFWETLARTLEAGRFDGFFFADVLSFYNETIMARGGQMSLLDPIPLVAMMARATSRIGLGVTISTSFQDPYAIARVLSSLDVLSGGRIAWNIVTSAIDREAQIFGKDALLPRSERYDRAEEVLGVCIDLWTGWADGALVLDKESGDFIDEAKMRRTEIAGKYVGGRGMFTVPPSPQRHPVIMQAGSSPRGRDFAASCAELVFTLQHSLPDMQEFYTDMKDRVDKAGRNPDDCAILVSVDPIVGETESIAREKQTYINELLERDPRLGIALVSAHTGLDLAQYPIDKPICDIPAEAGSRGSFDVILQGTNASNLTLGEAAKRFATSELCPQVVGTPESVADELQEFFENGGCDGFIVTPTEMPGSFEAFTRSVVPILQKRGVFRKEYPGSTLRETIKS
ncbi:LLM class flavin-dependent oxidoreductase [Rhizobium azibense]|uniref:Dibenzothiophene-5,5-dioxide monooxygenase n=1 Tax=Rhizobium azibense TaxID=1136135 RepID=A0A4R3RH25_9HYPH|nr:LLM class flavin-dependent oxidoreductase [Rhizobium azibense]TCU32782.1 dibenzothiophene-5,5-dioxide monooxygenase [Rhizobium azibense]